MATTDATVFTITAQLAHEMVRLDSRMANAQRLGYLDQLGKLTRYRDSVRDYRSALMRAEPVAIRPRCTACDMLIDQETHDLGQRCPWCESSPLGWEREHG